MLAAKTPPLNTALVVTTSQLPMINTSSAARIWRRRASQSERPAVGRIMNAAKTRRTCPAPIKG
ncbi:MAG: hypothetical protein A3H93_17350 [Rhodocyclales bacterium RIFCSPLOWO2_02_FULL_63_24]|nr:MAG: hypothetical protein A3H93_17350 [Rhodocyclales bacterium RIFCSPLOWO2_02_FULL_63_24]